MDLSNEKKRGCIWYIEDSIAQLYGDIIRIHTNPPSNNQYYNGLYPAFFFFVASTIESSNPGFGLNGHTKRNRLAPQGLKVSEKGFFRSTWEFPSQQALTTCFFVCRRWMPKSPSCEISLSNFAPLLSRGVKFSPSSETNFDFRGSPFYKELYITSLHS